MFRLPLLYVFRLSTKSYVYNTHIFNITFYCKYIFLVFLIIPFLSFAQPFDVRINIYFLIYILENNSTERLLSFLNNKQRDYVQLV